MMERRTVLLLVLFFAGPAFSQKSLERYAPQRLLPDDATPVKGEIKVTFLGTTTLLFDDGETQILLDGFLSRPPLRASLLGRLETDAKLIDAVLKRVKADRVKAVFVAHSHYDHALDCAYVTKATGAVLHGSKSTLNIGRGGGVPEEKLASFESGKAVAVGQFKITVLESKHSPPVKGVNDDLGKTIDAPLKQPAAPQDYKEGGSFDFLIEHGGNSILVKPSGSFIDGAMDKIKADVLFLGVGSVGTQPQEFRDRFYAQTVAKVKPSLVIPIHWDNFFKPLSEKLEMPEPPMDDPAASLDDLIARLAKDKVRFGWMQGFQSIVLFKK